MRRTASGDAVFEAFDQAIESYLARNRSAIEKEYKSAAGRPVPDSEFESFMSGLGDSVYSGISVDPAHLKRFVDFYVGPEKLQKAVTSAIEGATAMLPGRAASEIRSIADAVDRARRPSLRKVVAALDSVLGRL